MVKKYYSIILSLLIFITLLFSTNSIIPTKPILTNPNTQSSSSNFIFHFQLTKILKTTEYLMITFTPFTTQAIPTFCQLLSSTITITKCVNLAIGGVGAVDGIGLEGLALGVRKYGYVDLNKTIVISFGSALAVGVQYKLQILTQELLENINSISANFQVYTVNAQAIIQNQNWNFGQIFLEPKNHNALRIQAPTMQTNEPGSTYSNLRLQVNISVANPTSISRLMFIIDGGFKWTDSSIIGSQDFAGQTAPVVLSSQFISENIIIASFNESFASGRKFIAKIGEYINPNQISQGTISVYYLAYNSISPIEVSENIITIQTAPYTPLLQILTVHATTPVSPVQFYRNTIQYIKLMFQVDRIIQSEYVMQIYSAQTVIDKGSVTFLADSGATPDLKYVFDTDHKGFFISGFNGIPENTPITITMRISIPLNQIFTYFVKIDKQSLISTPIIQTSSTSSSAAVQNSFVSGLTGNSVETNKLTAMSSGNSQISFQVYHLQATNADSSLTLVMPNSAVGLSFVGTSSCTINGVARTCTLASGAIFTNITIKSNGLTNYYPYNTTVNVVISNINFKTISTHTSVFPIYFTLKLTNVVNAVQLSQMILPMVIPQRNQLTNFQMWFSNNIRSAGWDYPNIIRITSTTPAEMTYAKQTYEKRVITVFCYNGWTRLFSLVDGDNYPGGSSNSNFRIFYNEGNSIVGEIDYYLNWDRIHIVLDGSQQTTAFSVILPTVLVEYSNFYQVLIGKYNTITQQISYLHAQARPVTSGSQTHLYTSNVLINTINKGTNSTCQFHGYVGGFTDLNCSIDPVGTLSTTTAKRAALVVVSDWKWFTDSTTYTLGTLSTVNPVFGYNQQKPVTLQLPNTKRYLTFIPITVGTSISAAFSLSFNSIHLPYSWDLPNYNMYLVGNGGALDSHIQYVNYNRNAFYPNVLKDVQVNCDETWVGIRNTKCSFKFTTNTVIPVSSKIRILLTGFYASTSLCSLKQSSTEIPVECASSINKTQIVLTLLDTGVLTANQYTLDFYGISIINSTISHYFTLQILQPTATYVIQQSTKILIITNVPEIPIKINQLYFSKNNAGVRGMLAIQFWLPRGGYADQMFVIAFGRWLTAANVVESKLAIEFYDSSNTRLYGYWKLDQIKGWIIFEDLTLIQSVYSIKIYGIITPTIVDQDLLKLMYVRKNDLTYTLSTTNQSIPKYTPLTSSSPTPSSSISLVPLFNTESLPQQLIFTVTSSPSAITPQTIWTISLPRYFSQQMWNQGYERYCTINGSWIQCFKDQHVGYQIVVKNSPILVDIGGNYILQVYGIACPRAIYVNSNAKYSGQAVFFGVSATANSDIYFSYIQLFLTNTLINPQATSGYGLLTLQSVTSSNMEVNQATFYVLNMISTIAISNGQYIYIILPEEFDNLQDIDLNVEVLQQLISKTYVAEVVNRRLGLKLVGQTITANLNFAIRIASLPTPKTPNTHNPNKIIVYVASANRDKTLGRTMEVHNKAMVLNFVAASLHIVINDYLPISVTAGTFSEEIFIRASDHGGFLGNVRIGFFSGIFTFAPELVEIYLGDFNGGFRVGVGQNIKPSTYSYDIVKSQSGISALYTSLVKYSITVTNNPITISLPSSITVPIGGCSVPYAIVLDNKPQEDLSILFSYDSTLNNLHQFWLNQQLSYNLMAFNASIGERWLSFCAAENMTIGNVQVGVHLGGTNQRAYSIGSLLTVQIVNNVSTNVGMTSGIVSKHVAKTYGEIQATVSIPGHMYYELSLSPFATNSLLNLRTLIKQGYSILKSTKDYLKLIYQTEHDHRVGLVPVSTGLNLLRLQNLIPGATYSYCAYFVSQHKTASESTSKCLQFTTIAQPLILKSMITFTSTIYLSQLNRILCFFVKGAESTINQVLNLNGGSCSLGSVPQNYYYAYNGISVSGQLQKTIIYFVVDKNTTNDLAVSRFRALYNITSITNTALNLAESGFAINFISRSYMMNSFDPANAVAKTSSFSPVLTMSTPYYNSALGLISIDSIQLTLPGFVYFVLVRNRRVVYNIITGHTDIEIRPALTPSSSQILNCLDGYGEPALACKRVVYHEGTLSLSFEGIDNNSLYTGYYIVANEYPLRPIVIGDVSQWTVLTLFEKTLYLSLTFILFAACF